ncbi:MAG TPA: LTA synthase family protein [Candidatus Paceibacterota bacterium]|nr:LTA synthase family protein [Verrucomicrobiota bacterium]HSA09914.1 LTA synthase family protein [Candidatus Paceibacterota bacterium]
MESLKQEPPGSEVASDQTQPGSALGRTVDWYAPYLKRLALALLCLTGGRVAFALANRNLFEGVALTPFLLGLHFDLATLTYWYLPFHILSLPPLTLLRTRIWQSLAAVAFHISNVSGLLLNLIDAGFYPFSKQRSTFDGVLFLAGDGDVRHILPQYLLDWWYLALALVVVIALTIWLYRRAGRTEPAFPPPLLLRGAGFALIVGLLFLGTRSSRIKHPLGILHACEHVPARLAPVVLNTPFVVIKSYGKSVPSRRYFSEQELARRFDPVRQFTARPGSRIRNIIFVVLESLSSEFVGAYNGGRGYTPFLDRLAQRSTVCVDSFASVRRSIDVGPALVAGLPMLMNATLLRSPFGANQLDALPQLLKPLGYESWFFHGARPGSMSYDVFAGKAGFDHAFLKNDYPGPASDYDGTWGILDEPMLQFMARTLETARQPFLGYMHTLTSHHPFPIPTGFEGRFPKGHHPICETIGYTDFALQRFFETAETMPWFTNTVFIITADHTAQFTHAQAASPLAVFRVPIMIFDPENPVRHEITEPVSHVDLYSTVLGLVGWEGRVVTFGRDILGGGTGYAVQYLNNNFQSVDRDWCHFFDGQRSIGLFRRAEDPLCRTNLLADPGLAEVLREREDRVAAYVQAYTTRMIRNELGLRR